MKRINGESIEWRALSETMVLPVPRGTLFSRVALRRTVTRGYPFDLGGCRITRLRSLGAVLVTPPALSQSAASRPVPALAMSKSARVRRSLGTGVALYRFGTPRGYDYYQFDRRRLVACWSAMNGDAEPEPQCAGTLRFPRRALSSARADGRTTHEQRALVATVLLSVAALTIQIVPERALPRTPAGSPAAQLEGIPGASRSTPDVPSPMEVLRTVGTLIPDLQVKSFSQDSRRYRWQLETRTRRFDAAPLTEAYPELSVSVAHQDTHTTISLEGTR